MATIYSETVRSWKILLIMLPAFVGIAVGVGAACVEGEVTVLDILVLAFVLVLTIDLMQLRIEIDEETLKIRSTLGIIGRVTIPLNEIKLVRISRGWMSCGGVVHYTYPGEACVLVERIKGWSVSFTTNKPGELEGTLRTLGIPVVEG